MGRAPIRDENREEIAEFVEQHWGSRIVMSRGRQYYPHELEGIIDRRDGDIVGLLTFRMDDSDIEIMTLNSVVERRGIGTSLVLEAINEARRRQAHRVWLTTTNDNLRALGLYQRIGFRIVAVNVGAVDEARKIKPQIPIQGHNGIEIHDEVVLELTVEPFLDDDAVAR